jgi:hypothetical protein
MRRYCEDCGSKRLSSGTCPNCHEELYIYTEQAEFLPPKLSRDFLQKVDGQREQVEEYRREYLQ